MNNLQILSSVAPPVDAPCLATITLHQVGVDGKVAIQCDMLAHSESPHLAQFGVDGTSVEVRWINSVKA